MADFYQTGMVTTLHRLNPNGLERLENDLERFRASLPIGLVLPALYSEFEKPAMNGIVRELARVRFLERIVVALGRANRSEFERTQHFFKDAGVPADVLWMDGEPMQRILQLLRENGLPTGEDGKGRSCWMAYGYLLARGDCEVIALHDCDIVNYSRELLARLCYPVANPNLGFEFCKGYYARFTRTMHGRVTRLFVTPLIRAMDSLCPGAPVLRFLDSFRYALAGEFAMRTNLARVNRLPSDWGLEMGVLAEVYRNTSGPRICQVDLADNYEHKRRCPCRS
jgi:glucosyl-3-phosphoglycerate synthase